MSAITPVVERLAEAVVRPLLDAWSSGIAERRPDDVAALFTEDALFQGFGPEPGFGREHVAGYYAGQPAGLRADHELISAHRLGDSAVSAYARVLFTRPDGDVTVYLTIVAVPAATGWEINHYHVSKVVS